MSRQRAMEVCRREFRVRCRGPCVVAAARLSRRNGEVRMSRNRSSGQTCPNCSDDGCCCGRGTVLTAAVPCRVVPWCIATATATSEAPARTEKRKRTMQIWWLFGNGVEDPVPYLSPYSGSTHLLYSGLARSRAGVRCPGSVMAPTYNSTRDLYLCKVYAYASSVTGTVDRHSD